MNPVTPSPALQQWLSLAPAPPPLAKHHRWHVFLSYRSVDRRWVIQLYDVLRSLGFSVFLDQFVLRAADQLQSTLESNLEQSAAGILIWSTDAQDSKWCHKELSAMQLLEDSGKGFRFVITKLDAAELPLLARTKLYVDFADAESGPSGAGLLRLLEGIVDAPLSAAAVTLATEVDAVAKLARTEIRAARSNGNAERLQKLAAADGLAWVSSPALRCLTAEALISLKHPEPALLVLDRVEAEFPQAIRPRQLRGLALARLGRVADAQEVLGMLVEQGESDPETLGIYARTWMDRYRESGKRIHLERARDTYARAFAQAPSDSYVGINAAAKSLFLGDEAEATRVALLVQGLVGTAAKPGDYWSSATVAEVQLLQRNYDAAARLYRESAAMASEERASIESTERQAKAILDAQGVPADRRDLIEKVFRDALA